jgi:hypothetical protein
LGDFAQGDAKVTGIGDCQNILMPWQVLARPQSGRIRAIISSTFL